VEGHFQIETSTVDERAELRLMGELDLASSPAFEAELDKVPETAEIIVDLRELAFIDSTGISALVRAHQRSQQAGGSLTVVTSGEGQVFGLLQLTGLHERLGASATAD
jgi:anti-sigma B factor antagonist